MAFPDPPGGNGIDAKAAALAKYQARLGAHQKELDADVAATKAVDDAELGAFTAYIAAVVEVAKGSIDRARAGAEIVQKSAAALAGVYATLLTVAFSVTEHPFPSRGLTPLILLGLSTVLSTAYLSYLSRARTVAGEFQPSSLARDNMIRRVIGFVDWTRAIVRRQSYLLRASVVALALSLPFLASPFISIGKVEAEKPPAVLTLWPTPPHFDDRKLNEVLYTAQVNERADIRAKELAAAGAKAVLRDDSGTWWWLALAAAVALTFLVPVAIEWAQGKWGQNEEEGMPMPAPAATTTQ